MAGRTRAEHFEDVKFKYRDYEVCRSINLAALRQGAALT
jgi:hypothetical protein